MLTSLVCDLDCVVYKSTDLCDTFSCEAMMLLTQRSQGKNVGDDQ